VRVVRDFLVTLSKDQSQIFGKVFLVGWPGYRLICRRFIALLMRFYQKRSVLFDGLFNSFPLGLLSLLSFT